MTSFWDEAASSPVATGNIPKINSKLGAHSAYFIGFGEPYPNAFGEKDKKTGEIKKTINLKYEMPDGSIEQEPVNLIITSPNQFRNSEGKHVTLSASTLFDRITTFSGLTAPTYGPGDLARWAQANQATRIPVTVIIKQPGKYAKIVEVVLRQENAIPELHERSPFRKALDINERRERASTAQEGAEDGLFDDDDPAYK